VFLLLFFVGISVVSLRTYVVPPMRNQRFPGTLCIAKTSAPSKGKPGCIVRLPLPGDKTKEEQLHDNATGNRSGSGVANTPFIAITSMCHWGVFCLLVPLFS